MVVKGVVVPGKLVPVLLLRSVVRNDIVDILAIHALVCGGGAGGEEEE